MQRAVEMQRSGKAQVIPVILRACDWDLPPIGGLAALPRGGKAVTSWANQDEAWIDVVRGIREALAHREPPSNQGAPANAPDEILHHLEAALARKQDLAQNGFDVAEVEQEVHALKQKIREGILLRPGNRLGGGRYLLAEKLGQGGFGVVWKARDQALDQLVAVKVLHNNLAGDAVRVDRFFRGARAMASLDHPAVVRVLEPRGEDSGHLFFVMELVTGGDLRQAVLQKRIGPEAILPVILQVGDALAIAHAKRVVHRDIKPANILLAEGGAPKLTDFDLVAAPDTTGGTRTGTLGTFVFAAPECLDKPQEADARADVFGLGMTAIFGLYGADLPMDVLRAPERIIGNLRCAQATRAVKAVLKRAVEWRREDRFTDAGELCAKLRAAMASSAGKDVASQPPAPAPPHIRAAHSHLRGTLALLRIDTRPILGKAGSILELGYDDILSVRHFLNEVWSMIQTHVRPYTYNEMWVLRDPATGKLFTNLNDPERPDERSLQEVEIWPGNLLETVPLK
jgi:serine/threonine protein kinase